MDTDSQVIALRNHLDTYLEDSDSDTEDEDILMESIRNRSVFDFFYVLNKIDYPVDKIHLLVERIRGMTQCQCPLNKNKNTKEHSSPYLDLEQATSNKVSNDRHERDSKSGCRDNQFSLLLDSGSDSDADSENEN